MLAGEKIKLHLTEIDQVQVNGDRDRLKQVLLNLVANAIQYTPQGGECFLESGESSRTGAPDHPRHRAWDPR